MTAGPAGRGSVAPVRAFPTGQSGEKQPYLRAEIGALNTELDTCGTLKFGVPAAALRLTLPSGLRARHAFVCRTGGKRRSAAAQSRGTARTNQRALS